jgi:hypothetical protein
MLLSSVTICDTFTTESSGSPVSEAETKTFPGAVASRRFLVMAATITVAIRLAVNASAWMIRTGRRYPAAEPCGLRRLAHQISPRCITSPLSTRHGTVRRLIQDQEWKVPEHTHCLMLRWYRNTDRLEGNVGSHVHTTHYARGLFLVRTVPLLEKADRESRLLFSYPEYNESYTDCQVASDTPEYTKAAYMNSSVNAPPIPAPRRATLPNRRL